MSMSVKNQSAAIYERVCVQFQNEGKDNSDILIQKEWFALQPKLIICGGGHVAVEVAKLAKMLDFYVQVIDDREEFANTDYFPDADEICCHSYENVSEIFCEGNNNYYVVVTRGHAGDRICVEQILKRKYAYLGMIGSKTKVAKTFKTLLEKGYEPKQIWSINAPIGLSIKARTPAEIAVSIMAEIIERRNSKAVCSMSKELSQLEEKGTLCIITAKSGSSPANVGNMMFVRKDGTVVGTIGGGAIEYKAIQYAKTVIEISEKTYDLSDAESAELGMICGGTNRVVFIPLDEILIEPSVLYH